MTLRKRLAKLEAQNGPADGGKTIIRQIVWADGDVKAYIGKALTPTGWKTLSAGADITEVEFERRLRVMMEGGGIARDP